MHNRVLQGHKWIIIKSLGTKNTFIARSRAYIVHTFVSLHLYVQLFNNLLCRVLKYRAELLGFAEKTKYFLLILSIRETYNWAACIYIKMCTDVSMSAEKSKSL